METNLNECNTTNGKLTINGAQSYPCSSTASISARKFCLNTQNECEINKVAEGVEATTVPCPGMQGVEVASICQQKSITAITCGDKNKDSLCSSRNSATISISGPITHNNDENARLVVGDNMKEQQTCNSASGLTPTQQQHATNPADTNYTAASNSCKMATIETSNSKTPIKDFYHNATLLITGGTGFVGKVLIQKLLRSFEVRKIYMLIRCKDNMSVEQRLEQYFNESIFDMLRAENPQLFDKVHPIRANFSAIDLDIEQADRVLICNEVEILFNVVASVKFNEKLSDAIDINVLGTKKILDLAMEMKKLKSFVHISTLYCNCNRTFINEKVYENEIGYEKIMQISRIFDDETLEKFGPCLIGELPNTYTMTKKCAENLVNHKAFHLPAGIFRPPIVMSTYKNPCPGWTDNLYGPSGLCTWSARGLVRCIYGRSSCKANMVPADYCVNAMISTAWDVARRYDLCKNNLDNRSEIPVYNYIFDQNNLSWGQYMHLSRKGFHEPFDKALWCYSYIVIPWKSLHFTASIFLHHLPAYLLDLIAMVTGQKRIYVKAYSKITRIIYMMSWFGLKEWKFGNRNIADLDKLMTQEDKKLLQFNISTINWTEYFSSYLSGIRKYYFKDTETNLKKRRKVYGRILFIHNLLKTSFGITLIMCLLKIYYKLFKFIPKLTL